MFSVSNAGGSRKPTRQPVSRQSHKHRAKRAMRLETLERRSLMAAAIMDGAWSDPNTWEGGVVPDQTSRAIISHGITVELDSAQSVAKEVVVHGNLVVTEDAGVPDKTLEAGWVHVNSGGQFIVGTAEDRYDEGTFTLQLTGTDKYADHVIETHMMGMPGTMQVNNNDGFLMTGMRGRIQFYGEDKLSFTKLAATFDPASPGAKNTIFVENIIERNFNAGAMNGDDFVTSPADDGVLNWEVGDKIVVASSSYDYREEEVRTIIGINDNGNNTTTLTLDADLEYRHYGEIETYGEPGSEKQIDMRAEVALLSRNVKV